MSDQPTPSVLNSSARSTTSDTSQVMRTYAQDMAAMKGGATTEDVVGHLNTIEKEKKPAPALHLSDATPVPSTSGAPTVAPLPATQTPLVPTPNIPVPSTEQVQPPTTSPITQVPPTTQTSTAAHTVSQTPAVVSKPTSKEKTHPGIPLDLVVTHVEPQKPSGSAIARFFSALVGSGDKKTTPTKEASSPMPVSSLIPDMIQTKKTSEPTSHKVSPQQAPVTVPSIPTPVSTILKSVRQNPVTEPSALATPTTELTPPSTATQPFTPSVQTREPIPNVPVSPATQIPATAPPVSAMVMPQAPPSLLTPEQPVPSDGAPIPLRTTVPAPTAIAESREQLLARLHAKVAEHGEANERLVEDSVLPQSAPTTPELVPINNPVAVHSAETLSPLHTYKSDFSEHINDTHASGIEILAAQQDAAHSEPATPAPVHNPYAIWFAIGGVIFLITSMVGLLYAYRYNTHLSAPVVTRQTAPTLVFVDSQKELSGTGITLQKALAQEATQSLAQGSMRLTYISVATTTILGATTTVPGAGGYLIAALGLPIPDILMRNISLGSTVGVIHAGTQEAPFFVMHVASYDATFAGMLRWEKTMKRDLAVLYPPYPSIAQTNTATSTAFASSTLGVASSTVIATPVFTKAPVFVDKIIKNHDVRVLDDSAGRSLLLYGFWNKHTVIIARNAAAFIEIINRLNNSNTQ